MTTLRTAAQQALEALGSPLYPLPRQLAAIAALKAALAQEQAELVKEPVAYTTGHCKERAKPGGCQLHNLHCGYPKCDRKSAQEQAEPDSPERRCGGPGCDGTCCQPVQEPVAWLTPRNVDSYPRPDLGYETSSKTDYGAFPVYTAPPQREPLTDEEIDAMWREMDGEASALFKRVLRKFARAVERALEEKSRGR